MVGFSVVPTIPEDIPLKVSTSEESTMTANGKEQGTQSLPTSPSGKNKQLSILIQ
jgi:hypothetical protein